ncbi:MAG: hypothetical protein V1735_00780 [Nanoarchaeota archaeon]
MRILPLGVIVFLLVLTASAEMTVITNEADVPPEILRLKSVLLNSTSLNSTWSNDSEPRGRSVSCDLEISDRSIGIDEDSTVSVGCLSNYGLDYLETYLDYNDECPSIYDDSYIYYDPMVYGWWSWNFPTYHHPIAEWFLEDEHSSCEGNEERAYKARDICIAADADGTMFWDTCTPGLTDNYITLEVPEIDSNAYEFVPGQPFDVLISANAYYDINRVEIDTDCELDASEYYCLDQSFNHDITIYASSLGNAHQVVEEEHSITIPGTRQCVSEDWCGVSMRVYDNQGNYRFAKGFSLPVYQNTDCTLAINNHATAQGDNGQVQIQCDGPGGIQRIETYLDYDYPGFAGTCSFTAVTQCGGYTGCDASYNLPAQFYDNSVSPCYHNANAYLGRDSCVKAKIVETGGNSFYLFGDCDLTMGDDYLTIETPVLRTTYSTVGTGQNLPVLIDAIAYYGFDRIEIDTDCERVGLGYCIDDPPHWDADIVIDDSELGNDHKIDDWNFDGILFHDQDCITTGECGVSMRVYDARVGNHYRFAKGFIIDVVSLPSCGEMGGAECCGAYPEHSCTGNSIPGSSCQTTCCNRDCLPSCSHAGGAPCYGECDGSFVDTYNLGEGYDAKCCVGSCIIPEDHCSRLGNWKCCEGTEVCVGGGYANPEASGCGDGMCYSGCYSQECSTEQDICHNGNPYLSSCTSQHEGSTECGSSEVLCICNNLQWETFQFCDEGCEPEAGFRYDDPNFATPFERIKMNGGRQSQDYCAFPIGPGQAYDTDNGKNTREKGSCCEFKGCKDDECEGHIAVKEYFTNNQKMCEYQTIPCSENGVCVDGRCVLGDSQCLAVRPINLEEDYLCSADYDSAGRVIISQSKFATDIIKTCTQGVREFIRDELLFDDTVSKNALKSPPVFDGMMARIFDEVKSVFQSSPSSCSGSHCGPSSPASPPDTMLEGLTCGLCHEWSSVLVSIARFLGVPPDRIYLASYSYRPVGDLPPFTVPQGHTVAMYKADNGANWKVMDIAYVHAMFDESQWSSYLSYCDGCRRAFQNDQSLNEWRDANEFSGACANAPYCGDVCSDLTQKGQCSQTKPLYCDPTSVSLIYSAATCGCPQAGTNRDNVIFYSQGPTTGVCLCNLSDTCLANDEGIPYYCNDYDVGALTINGHYYPHLYYLEVDCNPGCSCPSGTHCGNHWCEVND